MLIVGIIFGVLVLIGLLILIKSLNYIGQTQIGLVTKRLGKRLPEDNPIAFLGEAGYQAELLYPGLRFKLWPLYGVIKYPWIEVPAGEIGLVFAQVGKPLPEGRRSAEYNENLGMFQNLYTFMDNNGQKGVQRPVLPPGTVAPYHPVGFLIATKGQVFGRPISPDLIARARNDDRNYLKPEDFGLTPAQLEITKIEPDMVYSKERGRRFSHEEEFSGVTDKVIDQIGIVTTLEGRPLSGEDIASRLDGWTDIQGLIDSNAPMEERIAAILGARNDQHNSYQNYQQFLDAGGKMGLQHDPILYGGYNLNPLLVSVDLAPMIMVDQGETAVIKAFVGLPSKAIVEEHKYGRLASPGYKGVWDATLGVGKYPLNPHTYEAVIVPTQIITLSWDENITGAHGLDRNLSSIEAKSREGFIFKIALQVQIHVPESSAPRVICKVGTMDNLINQVLQAAVGNHFRDTLQGMPAIDFIQTRSQVQDAAEAAVKEKLNTYEVETIGVLIQDVVYPPQLVTVLTDKEIANQEQEKYKIQEKAQAERLLMEQTTGRADKQKALAAALIGIDISKNDAAARMAEAEGEAFYVAETGKAEGAKVRAVGLAKAESFLNQAKSLGQAGTVAVNMTTSLADGSQKWVPEILVAGGSSLEGLAASLMRQFTGDGGTPKIIESEEVTGYDSDKPEYLKAKEVSPDIKERWERGAGPLVSSLVDSESNPPTETKPEEEVEPGSEEEKGKPSDW